MGALPLSRDPRRRERQLANLRPAPPAPAGNALARSHGGYATVARQRLEEKVLEVMDALAGDAPLRGPTGELPAADVAQVSLLAEVLCRLEDVTANVRDFGVFEQRGKRRGQVRPAVELESRLRREAADYLDALGMTPRSRARLGLDLQRSFDLAQHWVSEDEDEEERHDEDDDERRADDGDGDVHLPLADTPPDGSVHVGSDDASRRG